MMNHGGEEPGAAWGEAALAAAVFAVDPLGLGGVAVRARSGPVRDCWLDQARGLFPAKTPFRKLPLHISSDRLSGGIDLAATLAAGRPVAEHGLFAAMQGGVLVAPSAERMTPALSGQLSIAMDGFGMIAFDESDSEDEAVPASVLDRLAFRVDLTAIAMGDMAGFERDLEQILGARIVLPTVEIPDEGVISLCQAAFALGIGSLRAPIFAVRCARALAALEGRAEASQEDMGLAAILVFAPRAVVLPALEAAATPEEQKSEANGKANGRDHEAEAENAPDDERLTEMILAAVQASMPANALDKLKSQNSRGKPSSGKVSGGKLIANRGRPAGLKRGAPRDGERLAIIDTLRAAAPWQSLRRNLSLPVQDGLAASHGSRRTCGAPHHEGIALCSVLTPCICSVCSAPHHEDIVLARPEGIAPFRPEGIAHEPHPEERLRRVSKDAHIEVRRDDLRVRRYKARAQTATIFLVDASGSTALQRLGEAKGAVELLLADCYIRRDQVALIAFRGREAQTLLPPTRSLTRAKRSLASLAGGGGTPLATGLSAAAALVLSVRRKGAAPLIVLLTDGRANVAADGSGGREKAQSDAVAAGRQFRRFGVPALLIDTSPRPQASAENLAREMAARYLPLPYADAAALSNAARRMQAP